MTQIAQVDVAIVADDKTAKGVASAQKRVSGVVKKVSKGAEEIADRSDRSIRRSGLGIVRTFGQVERASARAFGGSSLTSGLAGRMGAVREAASALGSGLGEAATAGGVLEGAMVAVGATAVATVAVLAAAGYAAFKLADGWVKGAASIGRLSQTLGVATHDLQAFQAAGERAGVDKGTSAGALAGLGQTFNDARYGRNNTAVALMSRLGLKFRTGADGQLDTMNMSLDLADAIKRQRNAQTRRMIGSQFGISDAALPMFMQGSGALRADMADAGKHGAVINDRGIATGTRLARKGVIAAQMLERGQMAAGGAVAAASEPALDRAIGAGQQLIDGSRTFSSTVRDGFKPAAEKIERGAARIAEAAHAMVEGRADAMGAGSGGGRRSLAQRIEQLGENSRQDQVSPKGAVGVMQVMPGTARTQAARMGIPFDEHRYRTDAAYNRAIGQSYLEWLRRRYKGDEVLTTAAYNAGEGRIDQWIKQFGDPRKGQISDRDFWSRIPRNNGFRETSDYVGRVVYGEKSAEQHHHHEIHVHPHKVTVRTSTRGSSAVAVSHADVGR